jgi:penicillin-binding protein 1A
MMVVDRFTGQKANFNSKETLVEAFKKDKVYIKKNQNLDINNRLKNNNILKFY